MAKARDWDCSCRFPYPNPNLKDMNGHWKCVERYRCIRECDPDKYYAGKTRCVRIKDRGGENNDRPEDKMADEKDGL